MQHLKEHLKYNKNNPKEISRFPWGFIILFFLDRSKALPYYYKIQFIYSRRYFYVIGGIGKIDAEWTNEAEAVYGYCESARLFIAKRI